jgi:hypothetical protein
LSGGIKELMCPSHGFVAWRVCRNSHDRGGDHGWGSDDRNTVMLTLESAGTPTNFNLFGGLLVGVPFASMPVKVHLQNQLLGDDCYIGSDIEPIVLQPANLTEPTGGFFPFEGNGTPVAEGAAAPLFDLEVHSTQGAGSFAVPAASGCGHRGFYDQAIDDKVGLPSSASTNSVTFNEATNNLVAVEFPETIAPNDGKELSKYWHSAVLSPEGGGHGSDHGHGGRRWSRGELEGYAQQRFRHRH